jgi:hypothetical protein
MDNSGRLPSCAHLSHPWRIHALTKDFRVEDVWALPTPGGADEFPRLLDVMASFDPAQGPAILRALFAVRWRLGSWLGLDRPETGLGRRVASLRDRLPADLAARTDAGLREDSPFRCVYATDTEAALEIANDTVHGVMHLGWVHEDGGGYRGRMAVLVKPNGARGRAYMAAIAPFRHLVVYPLMLRAIERSWGTVRQVPVPDFVTALSTLGRVDYADAWVVTGAGRRDRTAEQWARAILEQTPASVAQLRAGWSALGLRVDDDDGVAGWHVRRRERDTVLLGAESRVGMPGELLVAVRGDDLVFATMVLHHTPATRAVWAAVLPAHVAKVRQLLTRADGPRMGASVRG